MSLHTDNAVALWEPCRVRVGRWLIRGQGALVVLMTLILGGVPLLCLYAGLCLPGSAASRHSDFAAGLGLLALYAVIARAARSVR